jgi:hypothetical protein
MNHNEVLYVALDDIEPSRWRLTNVAPIDEAQVESLVESIKQLGMKSGIVVRPGSQAGKYEVVAGMHRFEAAKKAKIDKIPVEVETRKNYSDTDHILWMTRENAYQYGVNPGVVLNEVAAAVKLILTAMRQPEPQRAQVPLSLCFDSQRSFHNALVETRHGDGLGYRVIMRFLGGGNSDKCPRTQRQIKDALGNLKDSGIYDEIEDALPRWPQEEKEPETGPEPEAEPVEEQVEPETEKRPGRPKKPKGKRQKTTPIFNREVPRLFDKPTHLAAFKDVVTSPLGLKHIPVEGQLQLAKNMIRDLNRRDSDYGVSQIRLYVREIIGAVVKEQKKVEDKEHAENQLAIDNLHELLDKLRTSGKLLMSLMGRIDTIVRHNPVLVHDPKLGHQLRSLDEMRTAISLFIGDHMKLLNKTEEHQQKPQLKLISN